MLVYVCRVVIFVALLLIMIVAPTAQAQQLQSVLLPEIIINLPSRTLTLYSGETLVKEYPIAIGKPSTPTPLGSFTIIQKEVNPVWIPPGRGYVVPSGPDNPLGYRWMGFLPLYGVHGTNAPWAIGLAVSNGCIRMLEEDAEELYEVVRYGTPLKITYERVKVRVDENGQASIGIYPDVYGYRQVSLADVKNKLAECGLTGMASEVFLIKQLQDEPDKQVVFAKFFNLKVNDKVLNEHGVIIDDVLYIPIWPVATAKKSNVVWNDAARTITMDKQSVPGIIMGDVIYVTLANLDKLYGGQNSWNSNENLLEINQINVLFNGKFVTSDVRTIDNVLAVPSTQFVALLGQKVSWDASKQNLLVDGVAIPITTLDDRAYLQITKINEFFKAHVYWNESAHTIEITYPFKN